jgi:hypothetical protein
VEEALLLEGQKTVVGVGGGKEARVRQLSWGLGQKGSVHGTVGTGPSLSTQPLMSIIRTAGTPGSRPLEP